MNLMKSHSYESMVQDLARTMCCFEGTQKACTSDCVHDLNEHHNIWTEADRM